MMRRLMILVFTFVAFNDANCETSQTTDKPINVDQFYFTNPGQQQQQQKDLFSYYNQGHASAPVLYREDSGRVLNNPIVQKPIQDINFQATNGNGYLILSPLNQHAGYYQPTNQYSVARPFVESSLRQPQVSTGPVQFYPKFNPISYQKLVQQSNEQTPIIQSFQTPKQIIPISPDFHFKTPPLFQHQVYHPLHTSVNVNPQHKIIHRPYKLGPPTPPRIYKVFTPIIPQTERPVPQTNQNVKEEKDEINEEEDDDNSHSDVKEEDVDDDDTNSNVKEDDDDDTHSNVKEDEDDNDSFRPGFDFGKYRHNVDDDDDDRHSRYRQNDDDDRHSRYRHDDDDHDSSDTKKSTKYKYKYPKYSGGGKNFKDQFSYPSFFEHKSKTGQDLKPKVMVKMYKYTRSSEPQSKGSEIKPVVEHNQKTVQSKWIISTKTSSSTN